MLEVMFQPHMHYIRKVLGLVEIRDEEVSISEKHVEGIELKEDVEIPLKKTYSIIKKVVKNYSD